MGCSTGRFWVKYRSPAGSLRAHKALRLLCNLRRASNCRCAWAQPCFHAQMDAHMHGCSIHGKRCNNYTGMISTSMPHTNRHHTNTRSKCPAPLHFTPDLPPPPVFLDSSRRPPLKHPSARTACPSGSPQIPCGGIYRGRSPPAIA